MVLEILPQKITVNECRELLAKVEEKNNYFSSEDDEDSSEEDVPTGWNSINRW